MPHPNIFDGVIENEFFLIKSVLDHRDRLERGSDTDPWGNMGTEEIKKMIMKYMREISSRPMVLPTILPETRIEHDYWLRPRPMIPLTGRRESIFIIDDEI